MSMIRFGLAVLLSAAVVTPTFAEVKDPNKVVCKSEKQNDTRIPKRTCMTSAEWDLLAENAKRAAKDMLRGSRPWQDDVDQRQVVQRH